MLDGGIIQRLLEEKWKTFARKQFLKRLLILVVHLICMSLAVYLRPDDPDEPLLNWTDDPTVIARYCCEVGTILGVLSYVIFQQGDEIRNQGLWTFLRQQSNSPPKTIFLISNLLILACIPCRLSEDRRTEEAILLFAVPGSWFLLMFFAGAVRLTGPFVTMIYSMITGDMLTFGIIYTVVLFGFSQSFFFLYKGFPGVNGTLYHSYPATWMALFQITLGNYDYQELGSTTYPALAKSVFAIFMVFVPILLLNMLIAMMGNTYAHVIEQSEKEWMKQWAKIVITLERAIPQSDAHHYLQEYSISLGPSEDPSTEQRGVMVIKSKNKTRAKQRKGAVANWKRVGKVTINALKKKGMTGEEMRCLMWGRESINTPIKVNGPKKDATTDPLGPNLTGGFGDALTAALDVMAFTHELDINGAAQGLNLANNVKPPPITETKEQTNNWDNLDTSKKSEKTYESSVMFGALSQLTESRGFTQKSPTRSVSQTVKNEVTSKLPEKVDDPLRELVLYSNDENADPEKLKFLALSAANLVTEEADNPSNLKSSNMKSLAGIFAGTGAFIKNVEENLSKKYSALDPSDSEGFGEPPMLGKLSRSRRAKSAHARNSSRTKFSDKKKLIRDSDSSSTDVVDSYEHKIECLGQTETHSGSLAENSAIYVNPVMEMEEENLSVTISETITTQGTGSGVEVQSGNIKPKRKKRARTAKTNRIGPTPEHGRSCRSAHEQADSGGTESPDPLEPWSTKKIENMNKILAWENDHDSL